VGLDAAAVKVPPPAELTMPDGVVDRPAELSSIVKALAAARSGTVGITTGLYGAGGFGKTTLAQMVCADRRVRRRFGGRVHLVTVGRDVRGAAAIAAKVNDVIKLVAGVNATFTDPQRAGRQLGALLDAGPRRLLVLDDVWAPEQLAPLAEGGKRCARLVTTRVPELLAGRGTAVRVDQMSPEQARALLTSGLPPLDPAVVRGLLEVTGRWPLLLRLVSKILAYYARVATDVSGQGAVLVARLRAGGPAVVDDLLGQPGSGLDVGQPEERARAVGRRSGPVRACSTPMTPTGSPSWPHSLKMRRYRSPWWPCYGGLPLAWMTCRPRRYASGWSSSLWCPRPPVRSAASRCMT
jgi:NB-ARC domain